MEPGYRPKVKKSPKIQAEVRMTEVIMILEVYA
jgi:hypothetical protein